MGTSLQIVNTLSGDAIPLIVGVIGHRDVDPAAVESVRSAFRSILREVHTAHKHCPLAVMTSLATGADTLAADEAVAQNVPLITCLPMAPEHYESEFTPAERGHFRWLLAQSFAVVVVGDGADRENAYLRAGEYVAHHSHLLVAMWDGDVARDVAGTANIVHARLNNVPRVAMAGEYPVDVGPLAHIVAPRSGDVRADTGTVVMHDPPRFRGDRSAKRDFRASLRCLDRYHRDLQRIRSDGTELGLEHTTLRTDAVANALQRRSLLWQRLLFIFAFLAATAQVVYGLNAFKITLLVLAAAVYVIARRDAFETRYEDYRALAEGLRVQHAWFAAGLAAESVDALYLRMPESPLHWITMALRASHVVFRNNAPDSDTFKQWLRRQWRYHLRTAHRNARREVAFNWIARGMLVAAFGVSVLAAFAGRASTASVALAIGLLIATLVHAYADKRGYAAARKRSVRMFYVFDRARRELAAIDRGVPGNRQFVIRELGRESLIEYAEWLIAQRKQPLQVLPGG
jgi:hypothetical protein